MEFVLFGQGRIQVFRHHGGYPLMQSLTIRATPERVRVATAWAIARGLVRNERSGNFWEDLGTCCSKVRNIGGRRSLRRDWVMQP